MAASCAVSGGGPVISPDLIKNSDPGSPWFTICKVKGGANFAINVPSRAISKDKLNFRIWRVKHEAFRFVLTQLGKATVEVSFREFVEKYSNKATSGSHRGKCTRSCRARATGWYSNNAQMAALGTTEWAGCTYRYSGLITPARRYLLLIAENGESEFSRRFSGCSGPEAAQSERNRWSDDGVTEDPFRGTVKHIISFSKSHIRYSTLSSPIFKLGYRKNGTKMRLLRAETCGQRRAGRDERMYYSTLFN